MKFENIKYTSNEFLAIYNKSIELGCITDELDAVFKNLANNTIQTYTIHPNHREMYAWFCKKGLRNTWMIYSSPDINIFTYHIKLIKIIINELFVTDIKLLKEEYHYEIIIKPRFLKLNKIKDRIHENR